MHPTDSHGRRELQRCRLHEPGATKLGTADEAECQDDGLDPAGIVFPENPRQVAVWSFAEYSPDDVLAVRFNQEYSFAVFVNASVPQPRADAIVRELGQPE